MHILLFAQNSSISISIRHISYFHSACVTREWKPSCVVTVSAYYWQLDNKTSKNSSPEGDSMRGCAHTCLWLGCRPAVVEDEWSAVEGELGRPSRAARLLHTVPSFTTYDRIQTDAQSERPSHLLLHQGLNCTLLLYSLWCLFLLCFDGCSLYLRNDFIIYLSADYFVIGAFHSRVVEMLL